MAHSAATFLPIVTATLQGNTLSLQIDWQDSQSEESSEVTESGHDPVALAVDKALFSGSLYRALAEASERATDPHSRFALRVEVTP